MKFISYLAAVCFMMPASAQQRLDYSAYNLVLNEEFEYNGIQDPDMKSRWQYGPYHPYWSGGIEMYDEGQLSLADNEEGKKILRIHAQRLDTPQLYGTTLKYFKSGYISYRQVHEPTCNDLSWSSEPWPGFTYGIFEMRCKMPAGDKRSWDAWPAFWLTSFPVAEIDIFDQISDDPGRRLAYGMIDWKRYPDYNNAEWESTEVNITETPQRRKKIKQKEEFSGERGYKMGDIVRYAGVYYKARHDMERAAYAGANTHLYTDLSNDYHVYTVVWTPVHLSFFLDSTEICTLTFNEQYNSYDCPMRVIANLAVLGKGEGTPSDLTASDMYFDIDY